MIWDGALDHERQSRVFKALQERSVDLAGLYRTLCQAIQFAAEDGAEVARISVIGHCGRELMNGLPEVLSRVSIPRPSPGSTALKDRLPELLRDVDLDVDQDLIPVPRNAALTLSQLVRTVAQEQGRNRRLASSVVTDETDDQAPAIRQWTDAHKFFMSWTHLDRRSGAKRMLPSDDIIAAHLRVVEDIIETRTSAFFDVVRSVEDLLDIANATTEDDS